MTGELSGELAGSPTEREGQPNITLAVNNEAVSPASPPTPPLSSKPPESKPPRHNLSAVIADALYLLEHAAQAGVAIDGDIAKKIVSASNKASLTDEETVGVLAAITTLATKLKPVTAETLK